MKKYIKVVNKERCCGCTACQSICPTNSITMEKDEEGFFYPKICVDTCVNCQKCIKTCPIISNNKYNITKNIYAVKNKSEEVRLLSSSGGVFSVIASEIEKQDGVIYGVAFDEKFNVLHMRATHDRWHKFRSSKYVQSDIRGVFLQIKKDLQDNKRVLFVGTPCHVDGLQRYLKGININMSSLVTCDIICHGTPSPLVWQEYLKYVEKVNEDEIVDVNFRDKSKFGWHDSALTIKGKKNNIILSEKQNENFYFKLFFNHLILKPACYECNYSNFKRPGDITMGDFWGIEKKHKSMDDNKGTSLVMVNTKKGELMFEQIKNKIIYEVVEKQNCLQPNLVKPSEKPLNRNLFWKSFRSFGLVYAGKRVGVYKRNFIERCCFYLFNIFYRIKNKLHNLHRSKQ